MTIANFKPTVWESAILKNFHENSFVGLITTPPVEKVGNEKVLFNRIKKGVWKDYVVGTGITWDQVASTQIELTFPKQKYFAFMVDDCDSVQIKDDVLDAVTKEQSAILGETVDQEVIKFIADSIDIKNSIGTIDDPQLVNKANAYDILVDLNTMANNNKIPVTERYFIISPNYLALLQKDTRFTDNFSILTNGLLDGAKISGNDIICKADNPDNKAILLHKSGTGFGAQLDGHTEACRLNDHFADGVRGLTKYGYTQLREESSFVAHTTYSTTK